MTTSDWLGAHDAARALGISYSTLYRWRTSGLFKAGTHWRRKFPSGNSPVLYHLERCSQAMCAATATGIDAIEPPLALRAI
jgi:predicted site-specific integrase-resolvase